MPKESYTIEEKKRLVLNAYAKSYDYDMARSIYEVTSDERTLMENDNLFWSQLQEILTDMQSKLIQGLVFLASSSNKRENVRLEAINKLGILLYPEVFKKAEDNKATSNVVIYIPDNNRGTDSVDKSKSKVVKGK